MLAFEVPEHPFPECERLGVRVVHPEHAHSLVDPEFDDAFQLFPQWLPVFALHVERIDVFISFRRVLRVLDRAVGAPSKPFGMLADIRMVGRALVCDIQSDFHSTISRNGDETAEIVKCPQLRMYGLMPALRAADGPRTAWIAPPRLRRAVLSFAMSHTDGMDRREVKNIETHPGDLR